MRPIEAIVCLRACSRRLGRGAAALVVLLGATLAGSVAGCGASSEAGPTDAAVDAPATPSGSTSATSVPGPTDAAPTATGAYVPPNEGAGAWQTADPATSGWDTKLLAETKDWVGATNGTSFIVLDDGKILVEAYWGVDATTVRDVASAQKSVVSLLVGLSTTGSDLDATVTSIVGPGWTNDTPENESSITVRHLLTMTSGLDDGLLRVAPPGTTWRYNTNAYHCLEGVLEKKSGKSLQDVTRKALLDRIGAGASAWTTRPFQKDGKGNPIHALEMTARDMARVGLLVARGGSWSGEGIVPPTYLALALDSSQTMNTSYGLLWWLNGKTSALLPPSQPAAGPLMPSAPADVVAALGALDQKIYVARSAKLVVVRQGRAAAQGAQALSSFDDDLWKRLLAAKRSP